MGTPTNPATGLTVKQDEWCFQCVRIGDPHRAYRVAYSNQTMNHATVRKEVSRLLQKPEIQDRLVELRALADKKLEVSLERIAKELARIGFADMGDLYDDAGKMIPLHLLPEDVRRAVHSVTIVERQGGMLLNVKGEKVSKAEAKKLRAAAKENDPPPVEYVAMRDKKITLHPKVDALNTMARWKKMITERGAEDGDPNDVRKLSDEQLEAEIRASEQALLVIERARGRRKVKVTKP